MFNSDIDVVFFDPERPASDDLKIYQQLTDKAPQYQWQIKNEVYMAHYNFDKDPEFTSVTDAIGHFVEVPTCIGAFLDENQIKLIAPYGVDDLINFRCSPIPYYRQDANTWQSISSEWHRSSGINNGPSYKLMVFEILCIPLIYVI